MDLPWVMRVGGEVLPIGLPYTKIKTSIQCFKILYMFIPNTYIAPWRLQNQIYLFPLLSIKLNIYTYLSSRAITSSLLGCLNSQRVKGAKWFNWSANLCWPGCCTMVYEPCWLMISPWVTDERLWKVQRLDLFPPPPTMPASPHCPTVNHKTHPTQTSTKISQYFENTQTECQLIPKLRRLRHMSQRKL